MPAEGDDTKPPSFLAMVIVFMRALSLWIARAFAEANQILPLPARELPRRWQDLWEADLDRLAAANALARSVRAQAGDLLTQYAARGVSPLPSPNIWSGRSGKNTGGCARPFRERKRAHKRRIDGANGASMRHFPLKNRSCRLETFRRPRGFPDSSGGPWMSQTTTRLIRRPEVGRRTELGNTQRDYLELKKQTFPKRVHLSAPSGRAVAWVEDEIDAWVASRIAARDGKGGDNSTTSPPSCLSRAATTPSRCPGKPSSRSTFPVCTGSRHRSFSLNWFAAPSPRGRE